VKETLNPERRASGEGRRNPSAPKKIPNANPERRMQDGMGNVLSKKTYQDLLRQGLL
jgi:hypothetical protein